MHPFGLTLVPGTPEFAKVEVLFDSMGEKVISGMIDEIANFEKRLVKLRLTTNGALIGPQREKEVLSSKVW
jgi:hypothetical protein